MKFETLLNLAPAEDDCTDECMCQACVERRLEYF